MKEEREELTRLRKENRELRMERDILLFAEGLVDPRPPALRRCQACPRQRPAYVQRGPSPARMWECTFMHVHIVSGRFNCNADRSPRNRFLASCSPGHVATDRVRIGRGRWLNNCSVFGGLL
jgi:hypothetical protein